MKFLPSIDETSVGYNNNNGASPDQEQLTREDLKFSGRILSFMYQLILFGYFSQDFSSIIRTGIIISYD